MNALFPCDHEQCNRSALDCDRFIQLVLSGRPCFDASIADLEALSQELERCLHPLKTPQAPLPAPLRTCSHHEKTKICYLPSCPNKGDRISCGDCALRLHTTCAAQGYLAETAKHSETFGHHRAERPSVTLLRRIDDEWQTLRANLRDFLVAVEQKYLDSLLFTREFDLQTFVDHLDDFEVLKTNEKFEFRYLSSGLTGTFFQTSLPKALDELFAKLRGLEVSFRTKVSAAFVLGDSVHVKDNAGLIRSLKEETLILGDRLRSVQDGQPGDERRLDSFQKKIDEFWGVRHAHDPSVRWVSKGFGENELAAVECVLKEAYKTRISSQGLQVAAVEGELAKIKPGSWICEEHSTWPSIGDDLEAWLVVALPNKFFFLYSDGLASGEVRGLREQ